jgi:ATP-binding protein involved in chromosome partitioning
MSVGLLLSEEQVINPPASTVGQLVIQTMRDVVWGELDALLIDLPPSAGQPQEDLLKVARLNGVVIVTTPQDMSLLDAGRSLQMFKRAGVSILGIVENMSYFICPSCGERHEIFSGSGRWRPPTLEGVPVIGRVPLAAEVASGEWRVGDGRRVLRDIASGENGQLGNGDQRLTPVVGAGDGSRRVFDEVAAVLQKQLA